MESDGFTIPSFDYDDLDLDFSTSFVSQGENPTYSGGLRGERAIPEPSASAPESSPSSNATLSTDPKRSGTASHPSVYMLQVWIVYRPAGTWPFARA